jgi:hypothetical protein
MIEYEFEDLVLEFTPEGSYAKGYLLVTRDETAYGATTDVTSAKARKAFIGDARELYPEAFDNELKLYKALSELSIHVMDQKRVAEAKAEEEAATEEEDHDEVEVDDEAAEALISAPNVLDRYVEDVAGVHEVYGDRAEMKVVALGGFSAQLAPLAIGKPVGTNVILIGESGRGKNYIADAVASGMPDDFVYEFESASAKSFYYEADANPEKFKYTWVYPNEAEATDDLIETLRPLLSKAKAVHKSPSTTSSTPTCLAG